MKNSNLKIFNDWQPETELTVKVKFIHKASKAPLTSERYTARLYDKELFQQDEYLGHAQLNEHGEAHIHFKPSDIRDYHFGFAELPDLYVLLFDEDVVHFQSKVWANVDFDKEAVFNEQEGKVLDFGTFEVD